MELISSKGFNTIVDGQQVNLFTLKNARGLSAQVCNHGARLVSLFVPDKKSAFRDVVQGCSSLEHYLDPSMIYFGATIGPYANRISKGTFEIDGIEYPLEKNHNGHNLHSGSIGLHERVWEVSDRTRNRISMKCQLQNGEGGYPGNISITVEYRLTIQNDLRITYHATSDRTTHINLTNHSYFNLSGDLSSSIEKHTLQIKADATTAIDKDLIPTGKIIAVKNSPMDFSSPKRIGKHINSGIDHMSWANGYDHNFVLDKPNTKKPSAILQDPDSGRTMLVCTSEPGLHFFSGNFEIEEKLGKRESSIPYRSGLCLETQHFPDSPNQPSFPSTRIEKGEEYHSMTVYRFE